MSDYPDYQVGSRRLSTPSESIEGINATQTGTVLSGDDEIVYIHPPEGYLYEMRSLYVDIRKVSTASSGTHSFILRTEKEDFPFISAVSNYTSGLIFNSGTWVTGDVGQIPSTETAQVLMSRGSWASENDGFKILYINNTDGDQKSDRKYKFLVRRVRVM